MATEIIMPKLGLTMTEGTVDDWAKKEGDSITKGEVVCSISSEKLTHDVEAPASGILLKILVPTGGDAECKAPIGLIGESGEAHASPSEATTSATAASTAEAAVETSVSAVTVAAPAPARESGARIFITPLARKMAAAKGYAIQDINGSGGNGRITRRDVERYQAPAVVPAAATSSAVSYGAGLSGMRKTIAARMMTSLQGSAQVTIQQKADLTNLQAFKADLQAKAGEALTAGQTSITTLLSRAVILALKETPAMNASYANGVYAQHEEVHLGMAVAVADGLVVPVVHGAGQMTLTELGRTLNERISATRNGTLASEHYSGSTFTISNLGRGGAEYFTPILNTPEVGILGVGSLQKELAFDANGQVVQVEKLPLSLTFDHQVIDGAPAADFLAKVIGYLEKPYSLVL